jgi:uroporphyrin-III C-methyltransferase
MPSPVFLVGAGPGDPELLTLKALRVLRDADVILHDDLVSPEILALAPRGARVQSVGKRHGAETRSQEAINDVMIRYARQGLAVVRLKGGDPLIFGRAAEEIEALRAAGIDVEIVSGITAAAAAAAEAGVALTDRRHGSALVLLAGHQCAAGTAPDWRALVRLRATIAVYMPGGRYRELALELMSAGLDPATPCLVVSRATLPDQQTHGTTVEQLIDTPDLPSPAILMVGATPQRDRTGTRIRRSSSVNRCSLRTGSNATSVPINASPHARSSYAVSSAASALERSPSAACTCAIDSDET